MREQQGGERGTLTVEWLAESWMHELTTPPLAVVFARVRSPHACRLSQRARCRS